MKSEAVDEEIKVANLTKKEEIKVIPEENPQTTRSNKWIIWSLAAVFILGGMATLFLYRDEKLLKETLPFFEIFLSQEFLIFIVVGFLAQMVDGALGMAYGVTSSTFLISFGITPAAASAGVHISKVFTSGVSGYSHWRFGNVNHKLFKKLILPGMIGAIVGAYFLTAVDGKLVKPFVSVYLVVMGIIIIRKAFKKIKKKKKTKRLGPLALFGGFVDSIGGGGWGPVVTSTLIGNGRNAKYTIGSVNLAEFFVAIASAATFTLIMEFENLVVVVGLIVGGVIAAPLAALVVGKVKTKYLMILVGSLITLLSLRTIVLALIN